MPSELVQRFSNDVAPRLLARFSNDGVSSVARVVIPNADPLLAPTVGEAEPIKFNAVARGVSAQMIAADPNLVASDLQVICAAVDYVPIVGAMVQINSISRSIIRVDAIPAAGSPAAYRFFVR